jgi:hypothetical protein
MRKFVLALIVFLVAFAVPVTVYTLLTGSEDDFDTREQAAGGEEDGENTSIPQIISVPVTGVFVGEIYSYRVRALDEDGDRLEYQARLYPSWLEWDERLGVLKGTPGQGDIGLHRVELVVTDGKWIQTHAFDVSVTEPTPDSAIPDSVDGSESPDAEDVQGASSVAIVDGSDVSGKSGRVSEGSAHSDPEDYGFVPIGEAMESSAVSGNDSGAVLGEATTLPDTATFGGVLAVSSGVGVIALGLFLWVDTRWDISGTLLTSIRFERGEQITMDVRNGSKVKKRKIRL